MKSGNFKQLVKDYFSFTRSERKAMVFICFILLFSILLDIFADHIIIRKSADPSHFMRLMNNLENKDLHQPDNNLKLFRFNPNTISEESLDSLDLPSNIKTNLLRYRSKGGIFREPRDIGKLYGMSDSLLTSILPWIRINHEKEAITGDAEPHLRGKMFRFNPNLVTEEELENLGFNKFQRKNLVNYRSKGGLFIRKSDVMKVYGIDSVFFNGINDWIDLDPGLSINPVPEPVKIVELNLADSTALTLLPGIGPVFAGRIIHYRQALGGYYSPVQILEVYGMTEEKYQQFSRLITADSSLVIPVRINFADIKTLNRHPYITYSQAKLIIELRSAGGPLINDAPLLEKHVFDEISFRKVQPYLSFH